MGSRLAKRLRKIAMGLLAFLLVLCMLEGLCSFVLFIRDVASSAKRPLAERVHTEYDSLLGWINIPDADIRDMYGPGVYLKTNARRFRNNHDIADPVPDGKARAICSGDSFTLGYGVDNAQTWCHLLTSLNGRLETVNMGQGGYGVGQAYLWFQRDGQPLAHDLHIFAFITIDFLRMQTDNFQGYGKPMLKLSGGNLVPDRVPVSKRAFHVPWLTQNAALVREVKIVRAVGGIVKRLTSDSEHAAGLNDEQTREIVGKILDELQATNRKKGSVLVLVYLPVKEDYQARTPGPWRRFIRQAAAKKGIAFVDLIEELQKVAPEDIDSLFLGHDVMGFPDAAGHYSVKGNKLIAKMLHARLIEIPEAAAKLSGRAEAPRPTSRSAPGKGSQR